MYHFRPLVKSILGEKIDGGGLDSYNDVFTYHRRGAKAYVDGLAADIPADVMRTDAGCTRVDLYRRAAYVGNERASIGW